MTGSATRSTSSTGLSSNVAAALAYLFGGIGGIVLLIVERKDRYVRFHAMQSALVFLGVVVMALILGSLPLVGRLLTAMFSVAVALMWLVLMFKAFTGQHFKLPYVGEIAERQIR
ncbi:MAG: hypothetical protein B7X11_03350 [Acidobacteria bacterium 37-65-4]|nr:MAG: hypothetical protein B7X11_03350 [Acidobacteria bacterium 37-65-4]